MLKNIHSLHILCFFFLILLSGKLSIWGQETDLLEKLQLSIETAPIFDAAKVQKIEELRVRLYRARESDLQGRYELNKNLLDEFRVFQQDSAFSYGLRTRELATALGRKDLVAGANIALADISVASGMYKETLDFLENVNSDSIPENLRSLYFGLLGRVYSEMAEYATLTYFSADYNNLAASYRQRALELAEEGTFFHHFLKAFIRYNQGDSEEAFRDFNSLLDRDLLPREEALVHYLLGDLYARAGKEEQAIEHFARASLIDVLTSTKETLAIIRLSELLFRKDDLKNASFFIQKANEDAAFYGAQHRKIQVGAILPLIEERVITRVEEQRQRLWTQNLLMSLLLLFVVGLAFVIYLQVRRLQAARKELLLAHRNLQEVNDQIRNVNREINIKNRELKNVNEKLVEANKIKEEYIGFFFSRDADLFEKFGEMKTKLEADLEAEEVGKAKYRLGNYNLKKEKEKLLKQFDEAFLKLFPNFIEEFNSLLKGSEQIQLKKGQILNKELRIFALIRLGINHNEIIAQILGYSVNSIYAYKTKIRKRSVLDKREFDEKLIENTTLKL